MDQQGFAGLQTAALKHVVPHRKHSFGQCGSFDHTQANGHGQAVAEIDNNELGIATGRQQGTHGIAGVPAGDFGTTLLHGTRYFQAGHQARHVAAAGVFALAHQHIRPVHASGMHPN